MWDIWRGTLRERTTKSESDMSSYNGQKERKKKPRDLHGYHPTYHCEGHRDVDGFSYFLFTWTGINLFSEMSTLILRILLW